MAVMKRKTILQCKNKYVFLLNVGNNICFVNASSEIFELYRNTNIDGRGSRVVGCAYYHSEDQGSILV